jgi:hypothetical protein
MSAQRGLFDERPGLPPNSRALPTDGPAATCDPSEPAPSSYKNPAELQREPRPRVDPVEGDPGGAWVESLSHPGSVYLVRRDGAGAWRCPYKAATFGPACRHVEAAREARG